MTTYEYILSIKDRVSGTMRKVSAAQDKASSKFSALQNKLKSWGAGLRSVRQEIPLLDRALTLISNPFVLLTAGALAFFTILGSGTIKAAAFNHEFLQLKNLNLDKSKSQLQSLNDSILDLSIVEGLDPKLTSKAFYDIQSATGLYGKEVEDITRTVGRFSIATGADLSNSVNSTTKAMKAFGLQNKDIKGYLESNAKTVQVGITTFDELAKVQTEYAGAAAAAGQKVDTANKLFAGFTAVAKDSQNAATLTKTAFQGLTQANTIKGLKSIGVNLFDAKGQMRDMDAVIRELTPKLQGMTDYEFSNLSNSIGGPEGLRMLFNQLKSSGNEVISMLDAFDRSEFDIDKALENAKGDFTTLKNMVGNQLNGVMIQLGQVILPPIVRMLHGINQTIIGMQAWFKSNKAEILLWGQALGVTLGTASALWAIMNAKLIFSAAMFGVTTAATWLWTAAQWALNVAMNANPIGIVIGLIAALAGAIYLAYQKFDWFREIVDGSFAAIKQFGKVIFGSLLSGVKSLISGFVGLGSALWKLVKGDFEGAAEAGKAALKDLGSAAINLSPAGMVYNTVKGAGSIVDAYKKGAGESKALTGRKAFASSFDTQSPAGMSGANAGVMPMGIGSDIIEDTPGATNGLDAITGGGAKATNINITIGKLVEKLEVNTTNLNEGASEIEEKVLEVLMRVVNGANYAV